MIEETLAPLQNTLLEHAKTVIHAEEKALGALASRLGKPFLKACDLILKAKGKVVCTGMGKSGHIARKIAATLASTGTPAFFVHPGEAGHGDLGMIDERDVVLALSYSGANPELVTLIPVLQDKGIPLIAMTGNSTSPLAREAHCHLDVHVEKEACPLGLAPSASTTAALAMGDALALTLSHRKGFTPEDFARSHPGGALGKRLILKAHHLMVTGDDIPKVPSTLTLMEGLLEISKKRLGMTTVVDARGVLLGVYTDGDLRRTLEQSGHIQQLTMAEVMSVGGKTISPDMLAQDALAFMEQHKITSLVVVDDTNRPIGILHLHHILEAGLST